MALVGASKLLARAGVMRADSSRANTTSLSSVGSYSTDPYTATRHLWKRAARPSTTWVRVL